MARNVNRLSPASRLWFGLAGGGLLLSLLAGMLVPVYTDETGWRFLERAAIDGVDSLFSDLCGPNTLARPPWFMMPVRWFSAIANEALAAPLFIRLEGVCCALLAMLLLARLVWRLEPDTQRRRTLATGTFSLLGLGLLPYLLVWSRPEQPVLLTTLSALLIALSPPSPTAPVRQAWMKVGAMLLLSVVAQSYHMKGVLYAVVVGAAMAVCAQGQRTRTPRLVGLAALLSFALASGIYWVERLRCLGNSQLAAMYGRENIAAAIASSQDATEVAMHLIHGLNPLNYIQLAAPSADPMSQWVPVDSFSPMQIAVVSTLLVLGWLIAGSVALFSLIRFALARRLEALREPRFVLACALVAVVEVWNVSQLSRNVYEAAHVLPALAVAGLLALTLPSARAAADRPPPHFLPVAVMLALAAQITVAWTLVPTLMRSAQQTGYIDGQPSSVSIRDYAPIKRDIAAAMTAAGLPTDRRLHRLLIDELTYLALQEHRLPLHRFGVLTFWNGGLADPAAYLRREHSDGAVLGCHHLPPRWRAMAARAGAICAISRKTLKRL